MSPTNSVQEASKLDFELLVKRIQNSTNALQENARMVINRNVTVRAWLTGFYIVEYEQNGKLQKKRFFASIFSPYVVK